MTDEVRLRELLSLYEQRRRHGDDPTAIELCADSPHLAPALAERIAALRGLEALAGQLNETAGTPAGPASETHSVSPPSGRPFPALPGYEVLGELGHGGMGVVYRARPLGANRLVALKMIRAVEHASPTERLRFQIETEAVARLQHPNIVQLHEVGEVSGQPFFSLEFCDGGTLAEQLKKQRPTPNEAARLIETVARAMHYAHLRGVVHRDLKPGNVLLAGGERVPKIADFGLAKRIDADARDVSQSGAIMGTAAYMAPEQAAGKVRDTGPAADLYALGALLYECLAGRPPFEGPQHVVLLSVLNDEPAPPSRVGGKVPADLETICLKCLSKEPAKRYASAEELANDLRRFQGGEPIRARPVGALERTWKWARRRPALAALLGVVLLALVSLAVLSGNLVVARNDAEEKRQDAEHKEQLARKEADKARKAHDFLASIFDQSELEKQQGTYSPFQLLDRAEQRIQLEFADHPELRADLMATLEDARIGLGTPAAMLLEVRRAVELRPRKGAAKQAARNVLLFTGDRLSLPADGRVRLVVLSDLHQEWLAPGHEVAVSRNGCVPAKAVGRRSDSVMMTFVHLRKGTFCMGWEGQKKGVKTQIKEDFEIAVHTVTQGQWHAVMGNNPSAFSRQGANRGSVSGISEEELKLFPVENVLWDDAQEFIKKLNEKERGRGYVYRLPTEAEWEYACRGGATSEEECSFHFYFDNPSNDLSSDLANFNGNDPVGNAPKGKFLGRPTRVGSYPPNKLGLCDMHGNVWQWCGDLLEGDSVRELRGGSWYDFGALCTAARRCGVAPSFRFINSGFRLARVPVR
jgi:formylglycine-generating enzyme required for sulfatase activity